MNAKANPYIAACPSRQIVSALGSKWVLLIIPLLSGGAKRNSELLHAIDGISQKMLTQTLKELEHYGIISRYDYQTMPLKVDYQLTALGKSLCGLIAQIDNWVVDNFDDMMRHTTNITNA